MHAQTWQCMLSLYSLASAPDGPSFVCAGVRLRYIYRAPPRSSGAGNGVSDPAGPVSPHVSGPERTPAADAAGAAPGSALASGCKRARASTAESGEDVNTVLRRSLKVRVQGLLGFLKSDPSTSAHVSTAESGEDVNTVLRRSLKVRFQRNRGLPHRARSTWAPAPPRAAGMSSPCCTARPC